VSWNVRGLGNSDKCGIVRNAICDVMPAIVCLQETKLHTIDAFKAKSFLPPKFASSFVFKPADGSRGGILTAWDPALFSLQNSSVDLHSLSTSLSCNATNLDLAITNCYGPSDHSGSLPFLSSLVDMLPLIQGPWIILGDFNLVRSAADKNNGQVNTALCNAFNETIQELNINEIDLSDRLYTWTNKQPNPILARLDRVFTNAATDSAFPLINLSSLPRPTSDHTPLLTLSTDLPKAGFFRFENYWLHHQSFLPTVLSAWRQAPVKADAAGQLAACIKSTRAAAKVWSRCFRAPIQLINNCQFIIQLFDYYEEIRLLPHEEFQVRRDARNS
jgi:exonuclease III